MVIRKYTLFLFLLFFIQTIPVLAQDKVGTTAAPFLGISTGPRATAMGGAFTAVADDAAALYYNPGAISQMNSQAMAAHTKWLAGSSLNWIGLVLNIDGTNAIGVHFTHLGYGEEEVTTVSQPEGTGENWSASDMALGLSYARSLTDRFSIGGSMKYIQQKIWHETSSAVAFDVGLLFTTDFNDMKLGMSISNFGTEMRMDGKELLKQIDVDPQTIGHNETIVGVLKTDAWPLPLFFRVGVAMDVIKTRSTIWTIGLDAMRPTDNSEVINIGSEVSLYNMFFLRGGYKSLFREQSEEGLTLGMGLNITQGQTIAWMFDYAYADFGMLDSIQMLSLSVLF